MIKWLHKFVSPKVDGPDSTLIKPSNWNEEHEVTTDTDGIVLGRATGDGPGDIVGIPITDLAGAILAAGIIVPFGGTVAPPGWYLCNGGLLNRVTDARLFAAIGTLYGGGDGSTTFAKPDLRGCVIAGLTIMGGTPDRGNLPGGSTLGATVGAPTQSNGVAVSGTVTVSGSVSGTLGGGADPSGQEVAAAASGSGAAFVGHSHSVTVAGTMTGAMNGGNSMSGSVSLSVVQSTLVLNYLIKA